MAFKIVSPRTKSKSSLALGAELMSEVTGVDFAADSWRGQYRTCFYDNVKRELAGTQGVLLMRNGLDIFENSFRDDAGHTMRDVVRESLHGDDVLVMRITGKATAVDFAITDADAHRYVTNRWAESAAAEVLSNAQQLSGFVRSSDSLLIALAAGAECAPVVPWLQAGGSVAAVMRPNPQRWLALFSHVCSGAELLVPVKRSAVGDKPPTTPAEIAEVCGLDLVDDVALVGQWVTKVAELRAESALVLGGFAYAGGTAHLYVQAAQDAVMAEAFETVGAHRLTLAWLATPTDSFAQPLQALRERQQRFADRSWAQRMRDRVWQWRGQLRPPRVDIFSVDDSEYAMVDCSADMQGPNYLLAKRAQRWRAMEFAARGGNVAYAVTPASRTHSVLDFKILRATYRGARRFGIRPFEVNEVRAITAMLIADRVMRPRAQMPTDVYYDCAVHGGLWSCAYDPTSIWVAATVMGWPALLRRGF